MEDHLNTKGLCNICHEAMTTLHAEVAPGKALYVCEKCIEATRQNFVWVCMHCGSVYIRPKSLVLRRFQDPALRNAYAACEDLQIIQGIDLCIECDPEGVAEVAVAAKCARGGGHC